jgi:hypothetical protein
VAAGKIDLSTAQGLVQDAVERSRDRHSFWRALERLYHSGTVGDLSTDVVAGTLFERLSADELERVNLVLPRVQLMIARLTARDPRPIAQSMSSAARNEDQERLVEAILEYFFNRAYGVSTIRDLAQDLIVCGNGFAKVMWSFVESEVDVPEEVRAEQLTFLMEMERQAALMENRPMSPRSELEPLVPTTELRVEEDEPIVAYVRPYDIFLPASARRLEDAAWVAQRVIMPLEEAQERYPNSDLVATAISADQHLDSLELRRGDEELVELFEFYHRKGRRLMVFTLDSSKPCFDGEWPYSHRHFPFVHLANHRARPSDFWAFGDLQQMAGLQERFNEVWTRIVDSTFRAGRKYLAVKGSLDEDSVAALESEDDDVVVFVDGPAGENPANLISPMFRQPISGEVLNTQSQLMGLMDQVVAFNDFDTGGVGADRMSATAAAAVLGVSEQRAMNKQLLLEEACSRIFSLMLLLSQEFLTSQTAVRIVGPSGVEWPSVTGEDLQGEFRLRVETGSMNGETRAMRRAEGTQILTQVVPTLAGLGYVVDGLVQSALKRMSLNPEELGVVRQAPPQPAAAPEEAGMLSSSAQMEAMTGLPMPTDIQEMGGLA